MTDFEKWFAQYEADTSIDTTNMHALMWSGVILRIAAERICKNYF